MPRRLPPTLFLLALGCGGPAPTPPANPAAPASVRVEPPPTPKEPAPAADPFADVPVLQPSGRFRLPGPHLAPGEPSVALSADGSRMAVSTKRGDSRPFGQVWQLRPEPKVVAEFPESYGHHGQALSPSGRRVLDGRAVYDVETKKQLARLPVAFVSHAFFRGEDVVVATQRSHGFEKPVTATITVWDVTKDADAGSFTTPDDRFESAFPAKGGAELWLFMGAKTFEVACVDIAARKIARTITPAAGDPTYPYTSSGIDRGAAADGSAFASRHDAWRVYDGATGAVVGGTPKGVHESGSGALLPDGRRAVGTDFKGDTLLLFEWRTGRGVARLAGAVRAGGLRRSVAGTAGGRLVVVLVEDGEGLVYDTSGLK